MIVSWFSYFTYLVTYLIKLLQFSINIIFSNYSSWWRFDGGSVHVIVYGFKNCNFVNAGYSDNMHYWIGLCRKEENLCIFHNSLCSDVVTLCTIYRCNDRLWPINTTNIFLNIVNHRRFIKHINKQSKNHIVTRQALKSSERNLSGNLHNKKFRQSTLRR